MVGTPVGRAIARNRGLTGLHAARPRKPLIDRCVSRRGSNPRWAVNVGDLCGFSSAEAEYLATLRIAAEHLLNLQREAVHLAAHVGHPARDPTRVPAGNAIMPAPGPEPTASDWSKPYSLAARNSGLVARYQIQWQHIAIDLVDFSI